jgi:hypothetical protein
VFFFFLIFFLFGEFSQPGDKNKRLANPKKGFLRLKKNRHILTQKNLEIATFTHLDSVCSGRSPELGRIPKKDLLVHQDSRHLLLISAEDPSHCTYFFILKKKKKKKKKKLCVTNPMFWGVGGFHKNIICRLGSRGRVGYEN